jgi:outer membrane lipoprotein-sorting protein
MTPFSQSLIGLSALACAAAAPLATLMAPAALAAPATPALSAEDQALVGKASAYLQGLNQAEGRFVQTDARGGVARGAFYLSRPGRIRFQYEPPSGLLVVADGRRVNIWDARLKSFTAYPLGLTPLHVFLAKEVRLDKGAHIERVDRTADGFSITARDAGRPRDGAITLAFAGTPLRLKEWTVVDAKGQRTRIELTDLHPASGLNPKLFVLDNPTRPVVQRGPRA